MPNEEPKTALDYEEDIERGKLVPVPSFDTTQMPAKVREFVRLMNRGKRPDDAAQIVGFRSLGDALASIQKITFQDELRGEIQKQDIGPKYLAGVLKEEIEKARKDKKSSKIVSLLRELRELYVQAYPREAE